MPFRPSTGGVETVTELVASALVELGHEVSVVTMTPGTDENKGAYKVLRNPSPLHLLQAYLRSEGVVLMGDSLRLGWPVLSGYRPALMIHHMFPSERRWRWLRDLVSRRCIHVAPSAALQQALKFSCTVVPNPYDSRCFFESPLQDAKSKDSRIIFVGRMIEEKGVYVLLEAVAKLKNSGVTFYLTLVGDGPLRNALTQWVQAHGLGTQVTFCGKLSRGNTAEELRRCAIAVVPSLCEEAFGLTALEAVACGCAVVASRSGGLPAAVGGCGLIVEKGDPEGLASALAQLLAEAGERQGLRSGAEAHLERHDAQVVAESYVRLLKAKG